MSLHCLLFGHDLWEKDLTTMVEERPGIFGTYGRGSHKIKQVRKFRITRCKCVRCGKDIEVDSYLDSSNYSGVSGYCPSPSGVSGYCPGWTGTSGVRGESNENKNGVREQ